MSDRSIVTYRLTAVTTPKEPPPPPRSAQKRPGCEHLSTVARVPSASTISSCTTLSTPSPYCRDCALSPPPISHPPQQPTVNPAPPTRVKLPATAE
eukprot:scaffold189241_cov31-Prasinocladus_malaysianus.AAC.2